jgi:hypothetical protein
MTDASALSAGTLCAARKLLKSSASIEHELKKTLSKCDSISEPLCLAVSKTLTKLCQDVAGAPLVLYRSSQDPGLLQASLVCLAQVLRSVRPEKIRSQKELHAALEATKAFCHRQGISPELHRMCEILVEEVFFCFQRLERLFQPPLVQKLRNARVLRERLSKFLHRTREDLLVASFSLLKLAVCLRALAEGCFKVARADKVLLRQLLEEAASQRRAFSVLLPQQRELLLSSLEMAEARQR